MPPRVGRVRARSLLDIALENAIEGCVRETYGAAVASWQAKQAGDPALRSLMRGIARDERRHAALSWRVGAWLERRLSDEERARVFAARQGAIETLSSEARGRWPGEVQLAAGLPSPEQASRLLALLRESVWRA